MYVRREPALALALVAALVQLVSAWVLPLTDNQQGVLNALAAAVVGVVVAASVGLDKAVPLLAGLFQAGIAVGLAFGWDLGADQQSTLMAVVTTVVAFFVRQNVSAKVPPVEDVHHVDVVGDFDTVENGND